jgi:hypothetical protein
LILISLIMQVLDMLHGFALGAIVNVSVVVSNSKQQHSADQKHRRAPYDDFAAVKIDHKCPPMDSEVHYAGERKSESHPLVKIVDMVDVEQHQDARNGYNRKCERYRRTDTRPQGSLGYHLFPPLIKTIATSGR